MGIPPSSGDAVALDHGQGLARRPAGHEIGGAAAAQGLGQLRHVPQVGERRGRQPPAPATPASPAVDVPDRLELAPPEHRPLGLAGGPRCEDDGDGSVEVVGRAVEVVVGAQLAQDVHGSSRRFDAHHVLHLVHRGHVGLEGQLLGRHHEPGVRHGQATPALGRPEPVVHAGGHGAELGGRRKGDGVGGPRGQEQGHDVAGAHAARRQAGGDGVGQAVEVRVAQDVTGGGDVQGGGPVAGRRLAHDRTEHGRAALRSRRPGRTRCRGAGSGPRRPRRCRPRCGRALPCAGRWSRSPGPRRRAGGRGSATGRRR